MEDTDDFFQEIFHGNNPFSSDILSIEFANTKTLFASIFANSINYDNPHAVNFNFLHEFLNHPLYNDKIQKYYSEKDEWIILINIASFISKEILKILNGSHQFNNNGIHGSIMHLGIIKNDNPNFNVFRFFFIGIANSLIKNNNEAINNFKQAIELVPNFQLLHLSMAMLKYHLKVYSEAEIHINEAIRINPLHKDKKVFQIVKLYQTNNIFTYFFLYKYPTFAEIATIACEKNLTPETLFAKYLADVVLNLNEYWLRNLILDNSNIKKFLAIADSNDPWIQLVLSAQIVGETFFSHEDESSKMENLASAIDHCKSSFNGDPNHDAIAHFMIATIYDCYNLSLHGMLY